jgi:hypothetical protein
MTILQVPQNEEGGHVDQALFLVVSWRLLIAVIFAQMTK